MPAMEVLTKGLAAILAMEGPPALEVLTIAAVLAMEFPLVATEALTMGQDTVPWDQMSSQGSMSITIIIMATQACSIALCMVATSQQSGNSSRLKTMTRDAMILWY